MTNPKDTHAFDQITGLWGTYGQCYAAFVREAVASGVSPANAHRAGRAAVRAWITGTWKNPRPDCAPGDKG